MTYREYKELRKAATQLAYITERCCNKRGKPQKIFADISGCIREGGDNWEAEANMKYKTEHIMIRVEPELKEKAPA